MKIESLVVHQSSMSTLADSLRKAFTILQNALSHLDFVDNFGAKEVTVVFNGSGDIQIKNPFRGVIPTKWIVVDIENTADTFQPMRGTIPWDGDNLYLSNPAGGLIITKVIFFR